MGHGETTDSRTFGSFRGANHENKNLAELIPQNTLEIYSKIAPGDVPPALQVYNRMTTARHNPPRVRTKLRDGRGRCEHARAHIIRSENS